MIPPGYQWRTRDGQALDIRWMDSVHLAHSFNMLCRNNKFTSMSFAEGTPTGPNELVDCMAGELKARGHLNWGGAQTPLYGQLTTPKRRESNKELCMFRAMMDSGMTDAAKLFLHSTVPLEHYLSEPDRPGMKEVIAAYTAYRLERS